jgi:peptidoglycan hydrolase-like protein with peptidoglycan-binding domain
MNTALVNELAKIVSQEEAQKALAYLRYYGYLSPADDVSASVVHDAVADFQQMFGLDEDGQLKTKDLSIMNLPRYGLPDREEARSSVPKWGITNISYYIKSRDVDISSSDWDNNIFMAFQAISETCNLKFHQVDSSSKAHVVIGVASGRASGFDGSAGTLAYAYLPRSSNYSGQSL